MTNECPVITIDGPSGSGKGTLCHLVADKLGWHILDSGVLYRALAMAAEKEALDLNDETSIAQFANEFGLQFKTESAAKPSVRIFVQGSDVTTDIRTEHWGNCASKIAAMPLVRQALLARQRAFARAPGLVTDGRDMGSVVFPDADLKIFLTASAQQRAKRRYLQLKEAGISVSLESILADIEQRDERDTKRTTSPLKAAEDAVMIDTTTMKVDEVLAVILVEVRKKLR